MYILAAKKCTAVQHGTKHIRKQRCLSRRVIGEQEAKVLAEGYNTCVKEAEVFCALLFNQVRLESTAEC